MFNIKCLGLYCGDCPLAIFLLFADQIKCVETSSLSISQNGSVFLHFENLFMLPGKKPVYVRNSEFYHLIYLYIFPSYATEH